MSEKTPTQNMPYASDVVEAEALAWVAQLNGDDVSEKDLIAFREWAQRSPAHQREIVELGRLWEDLNILTEMDESIRQADKVSNNLRKQDSQRKWQGRLAASGVAACFALALLFVPAIKSMFSPKAPQTVENVVTVPLVFKSEIGQQQTHPLEDGTVITLNTDSFVEVVYTDNQRNVRLIKGEALFAVAHDSQRPFLVFANDGVIRAVGTAFSVRLQPDKIDVIVSEGTVELSTFSSTSSASSKEFKPIDRAEMESLGLITVGQSAELIDQKASIRLIDQEAMDAELSWTEGLLTFRGESLQEVIDEVNRYTKRAIVIEDPQLRALRVGGVFSSGDTDMLLRTLEAQFDIVVKNTDENSIRLVRSN